MADFRHKLIKAEFEKRRSGVDADSDAIRAKIFEVSVEERELAKVTLLLDPLNNKIKDLGLKTRTNWFTKILQTLKTNVELFSSASEAEVNDLSVKFEYEVFTKAKNLITYQASSMKRISEINKANKGKASYLAEYRQNIEKEKEKEKKEEENNRSEMNEEETAKSEHKYMGFSTGFTNALSILSENQDKFVSFKAIKPKSLETYVNVEEIFKSKIIDSQQSERPSVEKPIIESKPPELISDLNHSEKRIDLSKISLLVVTELTILYKAGKFANKDLFKSLARNISHFISDKKKPCNEEVALNYVKFLTKKLSDLNKIQSEADYKFIFS